MALAAGSQYPSISHEATVPRGHSASPSSLLTALASLGSSRRASPGPRLSAAGEAHWLCGCRPAVSAALERSIAAGAVPHLLHRAGQAGGGRPVVDKSARVASWSCAQRTRTDPGARWEAGGSGAGVCKLGSGQWAGDVYDGEWQDGKWHGQRVCGMCCLDHSLQSLPASHSGELQ